MFNVHDGIWDNLSDSQSIALSDMYKNVHINYDLFFLTQYFYFLFSLPVSQPPIEAHWVSRTHPLQKKKVDPPSFFATSSEFFPPVVSPPPSVSAQS